MAKRGERRGQILAAALMLFNRKGESNVSTNHIAEEIGISPGNLYYHFSNKQAIIAEIFASYENEITDLLVEPGERSLSIEDMWLYLHIIFETIWKYRFIYHDIADLVGRNEPIRRRFHRILNAKITSARAVCLALRNAGTLQADDEEIRSLSSNITVIMTYWLNFQSLMQGPDSEVEDNLAPAIYHVMVLVAPYLEPHSRGDLVRIAEAYLE